MKLLCEKTNIKMGLKKTRDLLKNYYVFQNRLKQLNDNIKLNQNILSTGRFESIRHMFIRETKTGKYNPDDIVLKEVIHNETLREIGNATDKEIIKYFQNEIRKDIDERILIRARIKTIKNGLNILKKESGDYLLIQLIYFDGMSIESATHSFNKYSGKEELTQDGINAKRRDAVRKLYNSMKNDTAFKLYEIKRR